MSINIILKKKLISLYAFLVNTMIKIVAFIKFEYRR